MSWDGKEAVLAGIQAIKDRFVAAAIATVTEGSLGLQTVQRLNASHRPGPNVRTGSLLRGIVTIPVTSNGPFSYSGGTKSTVIYGRIQERGGTIFPKRGLFLYWEGVRRDGTVGLIRRRSVHIPARPYMAPGIVMYQPSYRALAARHFAEAIGG